MPEFLYQIPTTRLAVYSSLIFVGLTWFGIIFIKPFLRLIIRHDGRINELVGQTTAGFSLFYGLLLGLLAVAAYQNYDEVRKSAFAEAASLANMYRDATDTRSRCARRCRSCFGTTRSTSSTKTGRPIAKASFSGAAPTV